MTTRSNAQRHTDAAVSLRAAIRLLNQAKRHEDGLECDRAIHDLIVEAETIVLSLSRLAKDPNR